MKKHLLLTFALALLVPWATRAQEIVTIGTGTSTSYYVPFNSLYGYSFSEWVYPATSINMAGNITKISFYLGTSNSTVHTNNYTVWMKNVTRSSFSSASDIEPVTTSDVVFNGTWTIPANYTGWVELELDTPFAYDGSSNLMIAVHEYTSGYSSRYFTYTSVTGCGVQLYSDSYNPDPYNPSSYSGSSATRAYMPNIQMEISTGVISCYPVRNLTVTNPTAESLTLNWMDTINTGATYSVYSVTPTDTILLQSGITGTSFLVNNLSSNTEYTFAVMADCGAGDASSRRYIQVRTPCSAISSLPYQYGFDDAATGTSAEFPACWTRINDASGTTNYYPYVSNTASYVHSGSNGLYWYHATTSTYANNEYAILPPVDLTAYDISDLTLTFYARTTSASYHPQPIIGVMTDPEDATTFEAVTTLSDTAITTDWQLFMVPLSSYTGTGSYIAIKWPRTSSACNMAIDDIFLTDAWCDFPTDVSVTAAVEEITLTWSANGGTSFTAFVGNDTVTNITDTTYTFNNLTPDSLYNYGVATECASNVSMFIGGTIRTHCMPVATADLPWSYGFEDATGTSASSTFNTCLGRYREGTTTLYPYPSSTHYGDGSKGLYMYSSASAQSWLTLPLFETDFNELSLTFYAYRSTTATYGHWAVGVMTDPNDITTFDTIASGQVSTNSLWELVEVPLTSYTGNGQYLTILCPSGSAANYTYIDDIVVDYLPACATPTDLDTLNVTAHSVDLTWTSSAGEFIVEYGLQGFVAGSGNAQTVFSNSMTLNNLRPGATYGVYVTAICGSDTSNAAYLAFTTGCAPITLADLPYLEDFEAYGTGAAQPINGCWTKGTNNSTAYPYPYSTAAINGQRGLYFYGYYPSSASSAHTYSWAALPPVDESLDMSDLMVTFNAKRYSSVGNTYASTIYVGIADNVAGFTSDSAINSLVTWIDTIDLTPLPASTIEAEEVSFENYLGTGKYVVFYAPVPSLVGSSTYAYNYIYIDDITLRAIPTCFWPSSVALDAVTDEDATVVWTADARTPNPAGWIVEYGIHGFVPGDGDMATVVDTTATMSGLLPNTEYDVYISANCGGDISDPAVFNFRTLCSPVPIDSLPYVENFESYASGTANPISPCWYRKTFGNTTNTYPYPNTSAAVTGNIGLYGYCYNTIWEYAALPLFEEGINNLMIDFDLKRGTSTGTTYHTIVYVGVMANASDITTFDTIAIIDDSENPASSTTHHRVSFEGYTGTGRIAILWPQLPVTTHYNYAHIDNVVVDQLPDCRWPAQLTVDNVTNNSIDISFLSNEGTDFRVITTNASGTVVDSADITTTSYTVTGLSPMTTYSISVATICSDTLSAWASVTATTDCNPIDSLPWIEDFDSYTATSSATEIPCWAHLGGGYVNFYTTSGSHLYSGTSLRFYPNSSTVGNILVLPTFDQPISGLEISLMSKPEGTSSGSLSVGYVTNPTDATSFVEVQEYPISHFQLTSGSTTVSYVELQNTFAGAPATARIALRHNVASTSWYWFIDSINVHEAPACLPVSSLEISAYSDSSITVGFVGVAGNSFGVAIRNASGSYFDSVTITSFSHTFTGLNANTEYTISVTAICPNGNSDASTITARTRCVPMALPYTEDFEGYGSGSANSISPCWTKGTNSTTAYPYPYATNAIHGQRSLYFYAYQPSSATAAAYYSYAALPMFQDSVNNLMLSFNVRRYSTTTNYYTTRLVIGVMDNPNDISTFFPMDTLDLFNEAASSIHGYECNFSNYTGQGRYIAIYSPVPPLYGTGTYTYSYAYVDDIVVDTIPSCMRPFNVSFSGIAQNTATVHWNAGANAASFEIEYGPHGFTQGMGTTVTSYDDSVVLNGLNPSTLYDVYVRAICSATDQSNWSFVQSFATVCGPTALPMFFDPDSYATGTAAALPSCWTRTNNATGTVNYYPYIYSSSANAHTGNNTLYYYFSTSSGYANDILMAFPEVDTFNFPMNTVEVSFWAKASLTGKHMLVGVMTDPTNVSTFQTVDTVALTTTSSEYTVAFNNFTGNGAYVALRGVMEGTSSYYTYVDDINIGLVSPCPRAYDLQAYDGTANTVTLEWTDTIGSTQWALAYAVGNDTNWTEITANTNPYILTGLTPNTIYRYRVAPLCSNGGIADWSRQTLRFSTSQVPATVPYTYDFENAAEWANWQTLSNNTVNWYRGNAAAGDTTYAMYLSADNGVTQSWNLSSVTNAAVYRDFDFGTTPHSYEFTFDALMGGSTDGNYDGITIMVVDPAIIPEVSNTGLTSPWGRISTVDVRMDTIWTGESIFLDGMEGVKRLVIFHFNQATASSHPYIDIAPAIDNIAIALQTCERPSGLASSGETLSGATLSWVGEANALYQIAYREHGAAVSTNIYDTVTGTTYVVNGLNAATTYNWWVRKICALTATDTNVSAWSNGSSFSTLCGVISVADTLFEDFESYTGVVYNSNDGVLPTCWEGYNASNNFAPHVTNGGTYSYCISGTNAVTFTSGTSTTYSGGTDNYMRLIDIVEPTNSLTVAFWMCTESSSNGFLEVGYLTGSSYENDFVAVKRINASSATYHSGDGLQSGHGIFDTVSFDSVPVGNFPICFRWNYTTSYYSCCIDDLAVWSSAFVCTAPTVDTVIVGETSAVVSWTGIASNYEVAAVAGNWVEPTNGTPVTGRSYTFTGLTPGTQYALGVRAVCADDIYSEWFVTTTTTIEHPCYAPTNVTATDITLNGATIGWTAGEAAQTNFQIRYSAAADTTVVDVTTNPYTLAGLLSNTEYSVAVRAVCGEGNYSDWSAAQSFTTESCQGVSNVNVGNITPTSVTVTWNGSANSYEVAYGIRGISVPNATHQTVTGTSYTITGLDPETMYDVFVRSVCGENIYSDWSDVTHFATAEGNPGDVYYTLTLNVNDATMGSVNGGGSYLEGTTVTITATPFDGYHFVSWSNGDNNAVTTVVMNDNMTLTATFAENNGIDDVDNSRISLYPNPASSTVTLTGIEGAATVTVVDMNGREVYSGNTADGRLTIDVSGMSQGAYFVRITGEQVNAIRKLIVR